MDLTHYILRSFRGSGSLLVKGSKSMNPKKKPTPQPRLAPKPSPRRGPKQSPEPVAVDRALPEFLPGGSYTFGAPKDEE